jgi:hypothetical protein
MPALDKMSGHGFAHDAKTNETNTRHVYTHQYNKFLPPIPCYLAPGLLSVMRDLTCIGVSPV